MPLFYLTLALFLARKSFSFRTLEASVPCFLAPGFVVKRPEATLIPDPYLWPVFCLPFSSLEVGGVFCLSWELWVFIIMCVSMGLLQSIGFRLLVRPFKLEFHDLWCFLGWFISSPWSSLLFLSGNSCDLDIWPPGLNLSFACPFSRIINFFFFWVSGRSPCFFFCFVFGSNLFVDF